MRDILFRGKRIDNEKWVQGYYFQIWEKGYILWGTTNGVPNMIEVDPETVGQYTGLIDANKVKIFEGDIVNLLSEVDESPAVIEWDDDSSRFVVRADGFTADFDNYWSYELEVIGNIHDNSDLLEENEYDE